MKDRVLIMLAAGGTGGHMFPAQSLTEELACNGISVHLITDVRGKYYAEQYPYEFVHIVSSSSISLRRPWKMVVGCCRIMCGVVVSLRLLGRFKPKVLVGFGGYPCIPPLIAAWLLRIPICLHEQNSVMGRANRLFAGRAKAIALSFHTTSAIKATMQHKFVHTGNPVRANVLAFRDTHYEIPIPDGVFQFLIFGGSQGTHLFSHVVPAAIKQLDISMRKRLRIAQQVRSEDMERVESYYRDLDVDVELSTFFADIPARIAEAHLVIARSGATTIAELIALGRPSILVPLACTLDGDQLTNADIMKRLGAAWIVQQSDFTSKRLTNDLRYFMQNGTTLASAATAARSIGKSDAAKSLAALVMSISSGKDKKGSPE